MDSTIALDDWKLLVKMFPANWKELATSTKALTRKLRSFDGEESVMRALLTHIAGGYSLRETVTRLKVSNIADISDVALLKRLQCSELWLRELCLSMFQERGLASVKGNEKVRMRLVDGTSVKEPGKTGSLWKIHYSMTLPDLTCDYFKLTSDRGQGSGESFKQFPIEKGDCIIGDRGYSTAQGIGYISSKGANVLVRVNTSSLILQNMDGSEFKLLDAIQGIEHEGNSDEWNVILKNGNSSIPGRICVVRKNKTAAELALKKLRRRGSKSQMKVRPETVEFAKYVILFTTLSNLNYPLEVVLDWYRYRWQIELVFKRLKSLIGLGHLPKHDETSARAWLYGKLFTGLLVEKLICEAKNISPWGYVEK